MRRPPSPDLKLSARPAPRVLLAVGAAAFLSRLLYLSEHAASPFFAFPVLDELYYDTVARRLAAGAELTDINPGFRPLLYPWLLSLLYRTSPEWGPVWAVVAHHLIGVGTALLVTGLAFRLTASDRIALAAGLLYVLAGPPLFFEGELLIASLMAFLAVALVLLLSRLRLTSTTAPGARAVLLWGSAGAALAVAAQARPNVLLVALAFPLAGLLLKGPRLARLLLPAAAVAGLLGALALCAALQRPYFGDFHLTTGAGGVNFYLGNKRGADGMIPRQDRAVTYGNVYLDSVQVFAREEYAAAERLPAASADAGAISRYWLRRGLGEIAAAPGDWLGLMARKLWMLTWNYEIPNNKTYAFVAGEESRLLRLLPVRWWLLFALAPVGVAAIARRGDRDTLFWLLAFAALWGLGLVLFFVNSRYRIPLWPLLTPLAAAGGAALLDAGRSRQWRLLGQRGGLVAAAAAVSLVNWPGIERPDLSRDFFFRSLAHLEQGELEAAGRDADRALRLVPGEPAYRYQAAAVALRAERFAEAEPLLRSAAELKPGEPRIWNALGAALEGQRRYAEAYAAYLRALDEVPDFVPALVNAGLLELRAGRTAEAARHLAVAEATGEDPAALVCARGLLAAAEGQSDLAAGLLAEARRRSPELTERLLAESRQPVTLDRPPEEGR